MVVVVAVAAALLAGCFPLTTRYWVTVGTGCPMAGDCGGKSVGVSPDGTRVYVTGMTAGTGVAGDYYDYLTTAYNASDGTQVWAAHYDGPAHSSDQPFGLVVSPDGTKVYVTGSSGGYTTVAYNAANGSQLWTANYSGPTSNETEVSGLAVSADGTMLYVTGASRGTDVNSDFDYATVAYKTSDGAQLWVARYDYNSNGVLDASHIAASRDGTKVFVTGQSWDATGGYYYETLAYAAANGSQLWVMRYGSGHEHPSSLGVSPDSTKVYVTGRSDSGRAGNATVAYDAANGTQLWVAQYAAPDVPTIADALAVSPDGAKLYIAGESYTSPNGVAAYATVAYNTSDGSQSWAALSKGGALPYAIAVSPDGTKVYVTGAGRTSAGYGALSDAFKASDGTAFGEDLYVNAIGNAIAVSPDGTRLYITGQTVVDGNTIGPLTIAYNAVGVK
jgi:DNA-binding beta-propeller fold protein YncE